MANGGSPQGSGGGLAWALVALCKRKFSQVCSELQLNGDTPALSFGERK